MTAVVPSTTYSISNPGINQQATITVRAVQGISFVLTQVNAAAWIFNSGFGRPPEERSIEWMGNLLGVVLIPANSDLYTPGTFQWSGELIGPPSTAVTIGFDTGQVGESQVLAIAGFFI